MNRGPTCLADMRFSIGQVCFSSSVGRIIRGTSALIFMAPSPCLGDRLGGLGAHLHSGFVIATVGNVIPSRGLVYSRFFRRICGIPSRGLTILNKPDRTRRITLNHLACLAVNYTSLRGTRSFTSLVANRCMGAGVDSSIVNVRCTSMLGGICTVTSNVYGKLGCNSGFRSILVTGTIRRVGHFLAIIRPVSHDVVSSICLNSLLIANCSHFDHGHIFKSVVNGNCDIGDTRVRVRVVTRNCCNAGYVGSVGGV